MKISFVLTSLLVLTAVAGCKKNNDHASIREFTYSGSSDVLSEGRYSMQVLQTGNYTCFAGGQVFSLVPYGSTPSVNIDVYHAPTSEWSRVALSTNRAFYAATAFHNKLFIAGGYSTAGYSARVDMFDLATGQTSTPSMSQPRSGLAAAGAGNKVLFAGGNQTNYIVSTVDIYNTQTGGWTKDTLSLARTMLAAGAAGNKIVFAGGLAQSGNTNVLSNRADIYDVETGKWTQATISQPRAQMTAISAGNKIFFAGGTTTGSLENVDVYDVQANKWTVITLSGNTVSPINMATNGTQVFFTTGSNFVYNKLHIYELATANLTTVPIPQSSAGFGMAAIHNKLVMAGGSVNNVISNRLLLYDTRTNNFDSTSHNIGEKKHSPAVAVAGNKLLVAGGIWDGKNANNEREVINYKQVRVFEVK